jgi:hypothetical protein
MKTMKTDRQICHEHAVKCMQMAGQFDMQNREKLIQIALQWIKLAEEAAAGPSEVTLPSEADNLHEEKMSRLTR